MRTIDARTAAGKRFAFVIRARVDYGAAMKPALALAAALFAFAGCGTAPVEAGSDPGALGMRNYGTPFPRIYTSGQPSEQQFAQLAKTGITRVIQLRPATESGTGWEEAAAATAGVTFVRLPIEGKSGLTRANVERFAAELHAAGDAPTLVCCGSSNRVGGMFALKAAWLDGKPTDEALAIGRTAGMQAIESAVRELLAQAPPK